MNTKNYKNVKLIFLLAVLSLVLPLTITAQKKADSYVPKTNYRGTIVTTNGLTLPFTMEIRGTTSDADASRDLQLLKSKGQNGFQKAIEKADLGYFAIEGEIGQTLRYVRQTKTTDGMKLVAVFERWLKPFELRHGTRSSDYPFTYIEIYTDNEGKSTGFAIGAARVQIDRNDPNTLNFENFGALPAKIIGVKINNEKL